MARRVKKAELTNRRFLIRVLRRRELETQFLNSRRDRACHARRCALRDLQLRRGNVAKDEVARGHADTLANPERILEGERC